jgi:hypothetical protein
MGGKNVVEPKDSHLTLIALTKKAPEGDNLLKERHLNISARFVGNLTASET